MNQNQYPYVCSCCQEWETTIYRRASFWESFWKGWEAVMECPRCDKIWPLC